MLTRFRRYNIMFGVTILFILTVVIALTVFGISKVVKTNANNIEIIRQVVIDPGHGGIDPGAIGADDTEEKGINLAISHYLKDILTANGYEVIMTRETDTSINDPSAKSVFEIKSSDLKNRVKIIESYPKAIAVSIHQNKFPSEATSGAQMFYGRKNPQSEIVAQSIQDAFRENLQPDNKREIKRSTSAVYIIHNTKNPIVLVECGFISNSKERELLKDEEYQQKVAFTIYCGIASADMNNNNAGLS